MPQPLFSRGHRKPEITSVTDLRGKLMRYIKH
jgi:hypothetical protein